jgi:sec-independent protein translocase protein TatB
MFGMSLGEILIIAVIAILFIGPDKLPNALVQIAKFFRGFKKSIHEAKETFDKELEIEELKDSAINYKKQLESSVEEIADSAGLDKLDDIYSEFNSLKSPVDALLEDSSEKKSKKKKIDKKQKKNKIKDA